MIRWGFVGFAVFTMAMLMRSAPVAYADGCEGSDSAGGRHAIAFGWCYDNGKGKWVASGHPRFVVKRARSEAYRAFK